MTDCLTVICDDSPLQGAVTGCSAVILLVTEVYVIANSVYIGESRSTETELLVIVRALPARGQCPSTEG